MNKIYYGPPGTGKTHLIQKITDRYTDYNIPNEAIINAYIRTSKDWVLIALVILQNSNNPMTNNEINYRIKELRIPDGYNENVSTYLAFHNVNNSQIPGTRRSPRIFVNLDNDKWYVDKEKLNAVDSTFLERYISTDCVERRYEFITFHQAFTYEDFIEGIRPRLSGNQMGEGEIEYYIQDGIFKKLCKKAEENTTKRYALFIDEINRGNISEIFGDIISLIEESKRKGASNELTIKLPYSKELFSIPQNIDIFGTMNSTDKSIASIDFALRRRFEFQKYEYNSIELINSLIANNINPNDIDGIDLIKLIDIINKRINYFLGDEFQIGHAYFIGISSFEDIKIIFLNKIIPLLEDYFNNDFRKIQLIFNDLDVNGNLHNKAIIKHELLNPTELFSYELDEVMEDSYFYYINREFDSDAIIKIYN
ncbi:McrB family protein [Vallitalea guaymasensis]|uniref:McrB family protein n=1 Tax=Vallitalea guaymasensis TaxID=1185412 RepID=UPI0023573BEF|nr:AAA family ATPase [Vallitalea guaymasensis]